MTPSNSGQIKPWVFNALSLAMGLFFHHLRFTVGDFYGPDFLTFLIVPPVVLFLGWCVLAILHKLNTHPPLNRLWVALAAITWIGLVMITLLDRNAPAFWAAVIIPAMALLLATYLAMLEGLPLKALAVRLSNSGLCIFMMLAFCLVLKKITNPDIVSWVSLILIPVIVALAFSSVSKLDTASRETTPQPSKGDRFLNHMGVILIAGSLYFILSPFFLSKPYTPHDTLFWVTTIFTIATMAGCASAYRGVGRFGAYRHLCQAGLLIVLLVGSIAIEYSYLGWVIVGALIFYLQGTFLTALFTLWISARRSDSALQSTTSLLASIGFGFLFSFFIVKAIQETVFWIHASFLIAGMLCLQQLMKRSKIQWSNQEREAQTDWVLPEGSPNGLGRHHFFSKFVRRLARIVAEIFFGKIRIEGAEHLKTDANIILVANHPNTFLDPLIITAFSPGRLHYWAKSTLWKLPILGSILDRMGAIPVFRKKDSAHGPKGDNQLSIALAARKANQGAWLLIFPEGGSHVGLSLKPLKTGMARVAFRALEESKWQKDIAIVPVGLDYLEPSLFRTDLTIRIGEAIEVKPLKEAYESDPRGTVLTLTDRVTLDLQNLLPHLDAPQLETVVRQVGDLYGDHLSNILGEADPIKARKAISQAVNHYQQLDPDTLLLFSQRLDTYYHEKDRLATPDNHPPIPFRELLGILASLFSFVTYGIITNWIPYRLVSRIVNVIAPSNVWLSSAKLAIGVLTFGLYYFLTGLLAFRLFGGSIAFLIVASFIVSAFIALGSLDRFAFRIHQLKLIWQAFWTQDTNDDLEDMKVSLIQDLERFREAYAFYRSDADLSQLQEST